MKNIRTSKDKYERALVFLFNMISYPDTLQDKKDNLLIHLKMLAIAKCHNDERIIKGLENKIRKLEKDIKNEEQKSSQSVCQTQSDKK